jgi:hypothetical protein
MTSDKLRSALGELNGQRHVRLHFVNNADTCFVERALLVPIEADEIVKITDGSRVFLIDAERIAWIEIG